MALPDILARPFHLKEIKDEFDTGGEWSADTYNIDLSADKASYIVERDSKIDLFKTNVDTLINATSLSEGDKTTLKNNIATEIASLKTVLTTALNNEIASTYPVSIVAAIQAALDVYDAEDQAAHPFPCPQCATVGKIPVYDITGTPTGDYRACPLSDGYGYTTTEKRIDPNTLQYIDA